MNIDWQRVSANLRCPKCGDKAHIAPESDGSIGQHTHTFEITREQAAALSMPTLDEVEAKIAELEEVRRQILQRNAGGSHDR